MPVRPATLARASETYRIRALAADERAGGWTRAQVRKRWVEFVRERWRLLVAMAAAATVTVALVTYLAPTEFLRGAAVGAGAAGTLTALMVLVVQATGTSSMSHGASAEQVTASELRPLLKHGWRLINHVSLKQWDIDHVLVGPAGVIAVETKWSATEWELGKPSERVSSAVRQVRRNADDLRRWAPVAGAGVRSVWPTVFLWNPASATSEQLDRPQRVDGTAVVRGRYAAGAWRRDLLAAEPVLNAATIDQITTGIEQHLRRRDARDSALNPAPPTLTTAYWTVTASVGAFITSTLISLYAYTLTRTWWVWACVTVCELALGLQSRITLPRVIRCSWLAGAFVVVLAAAAAVVLQVLH